MAAAGSECLKSQQRSCCFLKFSKATKVACNVNACLNLSTFKMRQMAEQSNLSGYQSLWSWWQYFCPGFSCKLGTKQELEKQKAETFRVAKALPFPAGTRCPSTEQLFCATEDTAKVVSGYKLGFLLMVFCEVFNI